MRSFRLDGYVNIYELLPNEPRIYGTESLFGDWNAPLLVLAKDFAPSSFILDRIQRGCTDPYRHSTRFRTNQVLCNWLQPFLRAGTPPNCSGILYGSALAGLLRADGERSGGLASRAAAIEYGGRVLRLVIENMPSLKVVVCMGTEARACYSTAIGVVPDNLGIETEFQLGGQRRGIVGLAAHHPAARMSNLTKAAPWERLRELFSD